MVAVAMVEEVDFAAGEGVEPGDEVVGRGGLIDVSVDFDEDFLKEVVDLGSPIGGKDYPRFDAGEEGKYEGVEHFRF